VSIGEAVTLTMTLVLDDPGEADAVIDYRVHSASVSLPRRPKVFKLTRRRLVTADPVTLTRRHRFAQVSIRHIHPGRHTINIQVDGRIMRAVYLDVVDPTTTRR
jgi:hypothetical protein